MNLLISKVLDSLSNQYNVKSELEQLKESLYDLSARNPYLNTRVSSLCFDLDDHKSLDKLYQKAQFYRKEYGLESTLKVNSFLKWRDPSKELFYLSPFVVEPVVVRRVRKIETTYTIDSIGEPFINPILLYALGKNFDFKLESVNTAEQEIIDQLSSPTIKIKEISEITDAQNWELVRCAAWGNFNYKKSLLGQDFDLIQTDPSASVMKLLRADTTTSNSLELAAVLPMDSSQKGALQKALNKNFVLQGPPGTGKSHSIVNLIASFVAADKKVLFVSQKKSALDVVYDRLKKEGLENTVAYFNAEKDEKKNFYQALRKSWEQLQKGDALVDDYRTEHFLIHDYYSTKYQEQFPIIKELATSGYLKEDLSYQGNIPEVSTWKRQYNALLDLESKVNKVSSAKLSLHDVLVIHKSVFTESNPVQVLEKRLADLSRILDQIEQYLDKDFKSVNRKQFTQKCLAASVLGMVNKTQLDLLNGESKRFRSFSNWAKKYQLTAEKLKRQEQVNKKWVNKPSKSEITELMDLLKHQHAPKGIFGLLKRRSERVHHAFKGFDENISNVGKLQLLEELRSEWNLKSELTEIKIKLKHNFNVLHPEKEIDEILAIRNKLDQINVGAYTEILEAENSVELIQDLSQLHPQIQQLNHLVKFTFEDDRLTSFDDIRKQLEVLGKLPAILRLILEELKTYYASDAVIRNFVVHHPFSVKKLKAIVLYQSLITQNKFEPSFAEINGDSLLKEMLSRTKYDQKIAKQCAQLIRQTLLQNFKNSEQLMTTPASKLSAEEKVRKQELKSQKKRLVHEIGKKQQHLAVKDFSSQCWELLSETQKVWVMNPLSVSERLACKKDLFDVVIFDEASQIPLEDAVPAIYRSKQIVVVGDEKQMPPSSFFASHSESQTLLDKASLSFSKEMFKWHYRSEHPALIQFSNKQFYEDELLTFPSNSADFPINFNLVDGIFKDGSNSKEAAAIAKYVAGKSDLSKIGIVAFSKEQEKSITQALNKLKVDSEDLLIRNLENTQGIEKDEIIISIGYGKNDSGEFRMNFGPVNQENGPNRLNVLFSRAKQKMTVFSSVRVADFKLSDNPGVVCLTEFLDFAENYSEASESSISNSILGVELPKGVQEIKAINGTAINCWVNKERTKVLLLDPAIEEERVGDLTTILSVLKSRFKSIKVVLTLDFWNNPERFENEIRSFFK
ncbi:MAG: ATP-binding protein [Crocinitomicaceae bacterium]